MSSDPKTAEDLTEEERAEIRKRYAEVRKREGENPLTADQLRIAKSPIDDEDDEDEPAMENKNSDGGSQ